jgi:DNA adenine methylase
MAADESSSALAGIILMKRGRVGVETTQPLLKWAGGKRWLAGRLTAALNLNGCARLIEPFVGGAAFFFAASPGNAILGDTNDELIACYRGLRDEPVQIANALSRLVIDEETFGRIARSQPASDIERAVRLIYLNRTAFAGLWRVNRQGEFNVPFGCKPETQLPSVERVIDVSKVLKKASLYVGDFTEGLGGVETTDVVYCDPPYTVAHNNNGFIRYNEKLFSWADQVRLAEAASSLARRGCRVVVSNAAHWDVVALYDESHFARLLVTRLSNLAADVQWRGAREEALFVSRALTSNGVNARDLLALRGIRVRRAKGSGRSNGSS